MFINRTKLSQLPDGQTINTIINFNDPATFSGTIQSIAKSGITKVIHTPPITSGAIFAAGFDELEIDTTTAGMDGVSHGIVRYKLLNILGNNNTTFQFLDETKLKVTGTGVHSNISFYKPAIDAINGNVINMILFDGDMDISGISGAITNKYLLKCAYDFKMQTAGIIETSNGDQQVLPRDRCAVANNRYYPIEGVTGLFANVLHARDIAWAVPFICPNRTIWTRMGATVGTAIASSSLRFGIYKDNNGVPGALILDAGTVSSATTGNKEVTINQQLDAGIYWLVVAMQGGASDGNITYASVNSWNVMGMPSATAQDGTYTVAASGALPNPFGSGSFTGGGFAPFIWMRKV